jgi:hypothetical protein
VGRPWIGSIREPEQTLPPLLRLAALPSPEGALNAADDVTRFAPGEDDAIVMASLMRPSCMGRFERGQMLGLFIAPPPGLWIGYRFGRGRT